MNRVELEKLDRDGLIARAEAAGVERARILTRPELVDELLLRSASDETSRQRARGLFGRARDLLASVVERGLNLPDAADRIRSVGAPLAPPRSSSPTALPTLTLAEIYAAQGHRSRAIETLDRVLLREPDHVAASVLVSQLRDESFPVPPPRMPPEPLEEEVETQGRDEADPVSTEASSAPPDHVEAAPAEPTHMGDTHMVDEALLPPRDDVDECVAIPVDPRTLYVYWELRERTVEYVRAARPPGALALRLVVVIPTWDGPRSSTRDLDVGANLGGHFEHDLPAGCVVRAAIGYRHDDTFVAIAHSPALEALPGSPSPIVADVLVRWTPQGTRRLSPDDRDAPSIERALDRVRREASSETAREWRDAAIRGAPRGASERWSAL